jgi:hypothetical protein
MKEYNFDSVSATKVIIYSLLSAISTITATVLVGKFITPDLYPGLTFLGLGVLFFLIGRKIIKTKIKATIFHQILIINDREFRLADLISFNFDETPYLDKCTLRFKDRKVTINNPLKSKFRDDFLKFKKRMIKEIALLNSERASEDKVTERNFYNSKYAKPYAYLMIFIMISWVVVMITNPDRFKLSNLGLFLGVLGGFVPMMMKILYKSKKVANTAPYDNRAAKRA